MITDPPVQTRQASSSTSLDDSEQLPPEPTTPTVQNNSQQSSTNTQKQTESQPTTVYIRLPYTGQQNCQKFERQIRSSVQSAFKNVRIVTVYAGVRAFTMRKDLIPISYTNHVIYSFECRQCVSRYMGMTNSHLNARIRQHVPLHLLPQEERATRPKRGRPPKKPPPTKVNVTETQQLRRSERLKQHASVGGDGRDHNAMAKSAGPPCDEVSSVTTDPRRYQSSIANHLAENPECRLKYSDSCFVPLSRGRSNRHLKMLESVYIHIHKPNLCVQKNNVAKLRLFTCSLSP